ncbi:MAG: hypothetical protein HBSAPP03_19890 [Phycisphaerae bacterium]|nr:MAG: hypothetical protein HBSAPP03_19890 [Phycisphaerae bacterium]
MIGDIRVFRAVSAASVMALSSMAGASVSFNATDGAGRSATAEFDVQGGQLVVTLTNDASMDVLIPVHVLTCLFFEYSGGSLSLTPVSAQLNAGSVVFFGSNGGGNVGGEWAYVGGAVWPEGSGYGIGSAGLGVFGASNFNGPDLDPPGAVNGLNYGITTAGDNPATGNAQVTGNVPLIKNSVVFRLSGLPGNFNLNNIHNVWFQYGTDFSEPRTPAPGALALLGLGGLLISRRRR